MPTISRFYGISIQMYFKEEHGTPHFHARYAGEIAVFTIDPLERVAGRISRRAERLVIEWAELHHSELMRNWKSARAGESLDAIDPLP